MLTFAVADLHGRADLLEAMLVRIAEHRPAEPRHLVFLGDAIDRGPDSAGVVRRLHGLWQRFPTSVTCLMGNHEQMMLDALRTNDAERQRLWRMNGGNATLASFEAAWPDGIDAHTLAWLGSLPTLFEDARRYFVHAGFHPAHPVKPERRHDRLWMREPFLSADHDFGKHVVHGHTPHRGEPDLRRHRTNLDTGAVFTGKLVAGVFTDAQGPPVEILEVRG